MSGRCAQTALDKLPHVVPCDVAVHEQWMDVFPERVASIYQSLIQLVRQLTPAFASGQKRRSSPVKYWGSWVASSGRTGRTPYNLFDDILQLTHVARPAILFNDRPRFVGQRHLARRRPDEVHRERTNIGPPFAQAGGREYG